MASSKYSCGNISPEATRPNKVLQPTAGAWGPTFALQALLRPGGGLSLGPLGALPLCFDSARRACSQSLRG